MLNRPGLRYERRGGMTPSDVRQCTSCFCFLLCSSGFSQNGCRYTHYAIIDLNGDPSSIHYISMAPYAVRSGGGEKCEKRLYAASMLQICYILYESKICDEYGLNCDCETHGYIMYCTTERYAELHKDLHKKIHTNQWGAGMKAGL